MPHGPFGHRRRQHGKGQDVPDELSRLFGLDSSTADPAQPTPNPAPASVVNSPVAVTTPATTNTPAQSRTYLTLP